MERGGGEGLRGGIGRTGISAMTKGGYRRSCTAGLPAMASSSTSYGSEGGACSSCGRAEGLRWVKGCIWRAGRRNLEQEE